MNDTSIHIPEPCKASWDEMAPTEHGRYCQLCEKEVLDFSDGDLSRLSKYWRERNGQVCGRFRKQDLTPQLKVWGLSERTSFPRFRRALMLLIAFAGLHSPQSHAQTIPSEREGGQLTTQLWHVNKGDFLHFTGTVRDRDTQHPLAQASLVLMDGDTFLTGTYADSEGKFLLQIPTKGLRSDSLILKIRYLNHVFIRKGIDACSQDMTIDLNSEIWMKPVEIVAEHRFEKEPIIGPLELGGVKMIRIKQANRHPRYDTIEEWIWMTNSDVFSDDF